MSFKFLYYRRGKNLQDEGDRLAYIEQVLKEISQLTKAVERDLYLRQIASEFSLSLEALNQQLQTYAAPERNKQNRGSPPPIQKPLIRQTSGLKPAHHNAERSLIAHMLKNREIAFKVQDLLNGSTFNIDEHQAIITYLFGFYEDTSNPDSNAFLNYINDDKLRRIVADIEMMPINEDVTDKELTDYIKQVLNYQKLLKIKEMQAEQNEAERQKDFRKAASIAMQSYNYANPYRSHLEVVIFRRRGTNG
jgi:DNA primase